MQCDLPASSAKGGSRVGLGTEDPLQQSPAKKFSRRPNLTENFQNDDSLLSSYIGVHFHSGSFAYFRMALNDQDMGL
ncbi:hypothetical protein VTN96DRAFT_8612 [Rasamsonia emersonii]